jgi:hypothetical protein
METSPAKGNNLLVKDDNNESYFKTYSHIVRKEYFSHVIKKTMTFQKLGK